MFGCHFLDTVCVYRTLVWDKNNTSPQGLQDVASALEKYVCRSLLTFHPFTSQTDMCIHGTRKCCFLFPLRNYTIRFMPMPIIDAAQALRASPDKTEDALLKVRGHLSL